MKKNKELRCDRTHKKVYYLSVFIISILLRLLMITGKTEMRLESDDIGMLSSAARLAGYDWSETVSGIRYYGFGYYFIFAPILKWVSNPCIIWYIIVITNIIIISLACLLSFYILTKYLKYENKISAVVISIFSSLVVSTYSTMSQEPVLFALTWIITFFLIRLVRNGGGRKTADVFWIALLCAYSYLVHSRSIIFTVGVGVTLLIMAIEQKEYRKLFLLFLIFIVVLMIPTKFLQTTVIKTLWNTDGSALINVTVASNARDIRQLFDLKYVHIVFEMLVSNLIVSSFWTIGMVFPAIIFSIALVISKIFPRYQKKLISWEAEQQVGMIFSTVCYLGGIIAVAVVWGTSIIAAYKVGNMNPNALKGGAYYRYYATFFGPSVMIALKECVFTNKGLVKLKQFSVLVWGMLLVYFIAYVYPNMFKDSRYYYAYAIPFIIPNDLEWYRVNFKLTIVILPLLFYFMTMCKEHVVRCSLLIVGTCCLIAGYATRSQGFYMPINQKANAGYELVKYLGENYTSKKIYCNDSAIGRAYQFCLKEYIVKYGLPNEDDILFFASSEQGGDDLSDDFKGFQLDSNEWVWTNSEQLYNIIQESVYEVSENVN